VTGPTPEQARAALEWQAEEAAAARGVEAKVEALQDSTPKPPASPQEEQAAQLAAVVEAQLPQLAGVAWTVIDRLVQQFAGEGFALTPEERQQLAAATVPVVAKWTPQGMGWLTTTPEGALVLTAGMIYGFKVLSPGAQQPEAPSPAPSGATA
jgi:hypothetical protein